MRYLNEVSLAGVMGKSAELKQTKSGAKTCQVSIAVKHNYVDGRGERQEATEWHNITLWGSMAEYCVRNTTKGTNVYVRGRLQNNKYTTENGTNVLKLCVFVEKFEVCGNVGVSNTIENNIAAQAEAAKDFVEENQSDDLPF